MQRRAFVVVDCVDVGTVFGGQCSYHFVLVAETREMQCSVTLVILCLDTCLACQQVSKTSEVAIVGSRMQRSLAIGTLLIHNLHIETLDQNCAVICDT